MTYPTSTELTVRGAVFGGSSRTTGGRGGSGCFPCISWKASLQSTFRPRETRSLAALKSYPSLISVQALRALFSWRGGCFDLPLLLSLSSPRVSCQRRGSSTALAST